MKYAVPTLIVYFMSIVIPNHGFAADLLNLGPEEFVKASGVDIDVGTYSVPSFVDWDNDNLRDLIIGCGNGKVRVYLNTGTESNPAFSTYFYAQSNGADLYCPPSGCMGCFPRVVYWDADGRKDLLVGQSDGTVKIFLNINTDSDPSFDGGTKLQKGPPGSKIDIDVGSRPTCSAVDWNNDDKKDLVIGALNGQIRIFINEGTDTEPNFITTIRAQNDGNDLLVPSYRSSPVILDCDYDGKKDILTGNTDGQLLFYSNVGSDTDPNFSGYSAVESNGVPIDLASTRSRPSVCYWTGDGYFGVQDGYPDVLIGASDGKVHLYQGTPEIGDIDGDGYVDFVDFALLANYWMQTGCGECGGADIAGDDGDVDMEDLAEFTNNWLMIVP